MVPPFVALFALIVETSSLASLIDVRELAQAARANVERDVSLAFPVMLTALALYFCINFPISSLARRLERRLA
jgi:putative glutamine transport system permease protein